MPPPWMPPRDNNLAIFDPDALAHRIEAFLGLNPKPEPTKSARVLRAHRHSSVLWRWICALKN